MELTSHQNAVHASPFGVWVREISAGSWLRLVLFVLCVLGIWHISGYGYCPSRTRSMRVLWWP